MIVVNVFPQFIGVNDSNGNWFTFQMWFQVLELLDAYPEDEKLKVRIG